MVKGKELIKLVAEEHGVTTFEELEEKFEVEEIYFNSIIYTEFNIENLEAREIKDIVGGESEYRLVHIESGVAVETDYESIELLHEELS